MLLFVAFWQNEFGKDSVVRFLRSLNEPEKELIAKVLEGTPELEFREIVERADLINRMSANDLDYIRTARSSVSSLKACCRKVIKRSLRMAHRTKELRDSIKDLPLPESLKEFLAQ